MWGNKGSSIEVVVSATEDMPAAAKPMKLVPASEGSVVPTSSAKGVTGSASKDSRSSLGASLQIKGEISGSEDLHVDCRVDGGIHLEGRRVTVGANARITANITAAEIIVYGSVKGNLSGSERVEIAKDGSVVGELATSRIMIEDGAYFKGTIAIAGKDGAAVENANRADRAETQAKAEPSYLGGTPTLHLAPSVRERIAG